MAQPTEPARRECVECGEPFQPLRSNGRPQLSCSKPCADARHRRMRRKWRVDNLDRVAEMNRQNYYADPDKARARARTYYWENAERIRLAAAGRSKAWYAENRDAALEAGRERRARWTDEQREMERHRGRHKSHRRRADIYGSLVHEVTDEMVWEFNPSGPGCCNYCRCELSFEDRRSWHIDHVVPLARGGTHELSNLVVACPPCNHSKGSKMLDEWLDGAA